jgi:ankyrin repeat protein
VFQPEELAREEPLLWSSGKGTDVWALFNACIAGDLATVERLVAADPSLVRAHFNYRKPLYFAVRENRLDIAAFLLDRDPDPNNLWVNDTARDIARDRGYVEMQVLLASKLGATHNATERGEPVAEAIRAHDLSAVTRLLDADPGLLHAGDKGSSQPMHWATMTRQLDVIDELLTRGAKIDARRMDGACPIHLCNGDYNYRGWRDVPKDWPTSPADVLAHLQARGAYVDINTAAHTGNLTRVRQLLDQDPSLANRPGEHGGYYLGGGTPLKNAAATGRLDIVRLLLERGADPNLPEEQIAPKGHALYSAVYNGHYEIAKLLLEHGAYPSPPVESSADALSIAISRGDEKMVELLCSYGSARSVDLVVHYNDLRTAAAVFAVNPELANEPGAFCTAAGGGNEAMVRLMLKHCPGLPRRVGCAAKTRKLTELLFARGMDPSHPNWLGMTPLHHFAGSGELGNARIFLDHGASLDARDEDLRSTPLGWAAKFGKLRMVEFLLRRGARPIHPDDPSWATPRAWAERRGHPEIVKILERAEAGALPAAPPLSVYERLADDILSVCGSDDAAAIKRISEHTGRELTADQARQGVGNSDPRQLVARWHGFDHWAELVDRHGDL